MNFSHFERKEICRSCNKKFVPRDFWETLCIDCVEKEDISEPIEIKEDENEESE